MADIKIGISTEGAAKAKTDLNSIKDAGEQVVATNERIEKSNQKVNNSFKGNAGNIRNSAYQLQDLAVQIQGGTSVTTALSQQLPQLLSGFGLLGVVAGAAAAGLGLLINATDIFSSASEKASKALARYATEIDKANALGDEVAKFSKAFTETAANGFEEYVARYNKASASQRQEMERWLKLRIVVEQQRLYDLTAEAQGRNIDFAAGTGFEGQGGTQVDPKLERQLELNALIQKQLDSIRRAEAALRGDFGTATAGGDKQASMQTTLQQRIDALKAEAQFIGVSNAEREYGVMLAELEAQAKRSNISLDQKQVDLLKEFVFARDAARSTDKIIKYTIEQEKQIELLKAEGEVVNMTALQYKQLVDQKKLEAQLIKDTIGMQPAQAEAYKENARLFLVQTQELERTNNAQKKTFGYGAMAAVRTYGESLQDMGKEVGGAITNAFKGMEDAFVKFTMTGKFQFKDMANAILADMARIATRQMLIQPLGAALSIPGFANGGIMSSAGEVPLKKYASGGIANSPQLAMFGEGSTPEAFVPLPDGRSIPVSIKNGGGSNNIVVNVNMSDNKVESTNGNQLGVVIGNAVKAELIKQKRAGGLLA